ncbi:MAG: hypothetical protein EZS28_052055, partial [Streblomastix strix]
MLAPGSSWQHPFFNILANFPAPRRAQTTNVKEVNIQFYNKDSVVNFKCIQIMVGTGSGNRTGNQFLKIPGAGEAQCLGLTGRYLYIQSQIPRTTQSANSLVVEVCLDDNSIRKFIFGSLYNTPKTSGSQISLPFPIRGGTWTQICIDLMGLCDYFFVHKEKQFGFKEL